MIDNISNAYKMVQGKKIISMLHILCWSTNPPA